MKHLRFLALRYKILVTPLGQGRQLIPVSRTLCDNYKHAINETGLFGGFPNLIYFQPNLISSHLLTLLALKLNVHH